MAKQKSSGVALLPGTEIATCWEFIDKEKATQYLALNTRNRNMMETLAGQYAKDMTAGQWWVTHQGLAFDTDGILLDRQHTLKAIEESGVGQWLLVTRGLPPACAEVIDRGRARTLAHALQILGFEFHDHRIVAMARAMLAGTRILRGKDKPTDVSMRKFMERHAEAIAFVAAIPGRNRMPAPGAGALCRAYYHLADKQDLARFVRAFNDDVPRPEQRDGDRSARNLKRFFDENSRTSGDRYGHYKKAQNALRAYLDRRDLDKLYENHDNLFPIPEDPAKGECPAE